MASSKTQKEALRRQQRHETAREDLLIGSRVFLRNRSVKGRNKIQDVWGDRPHKVVGRPNPTRHVYVTVPLDGDGQEKTINRRDLLDSRALVQDVSLVADCQSTTDDAPVSSHHTDEDEGEDDVLFIVMHQEEAPVMPAALHKAGEQHHLASHPTDQLVGPAEAPPVADDTLPEPASGDDVPSSDPVEPPVKVRSTSCIGAGHHTNLHHLPRSTVQSEIPATCVSSPSCGSTSPCRHQSNPVAASADVGSSPAKMTLLYIALYSFFNLFSFSFVLSI